MIQGNQPTAGRDVSIRRDKDILSGVLFIPKKANSIKLPCMIVCHGAFEYKEKFLSLCDHLCAHDICAIAIDMPGHGESSGQRFHVDIDHWVYAIQATIEFLSGENGIDADRIGIFGFSSGGTAAIEAAIIEPRLKLLITLDATVRNYLSFKDTIIFKAINSMGKLKKFIFGTDLRLDLTHLLQTVKAAHDPFVNDSIISDPKLKAAYASFPFPGAAPCAFVDTIERVNRLNIPTLIMHGKQDQVDPPQTAQLFFDRLTCAKELKLIDHSGHCGHLDGQKNRIMEMTASWVIKNLSSHEVISNHG
jgi:alpha-beta hydrolase superfamily lysophospholipase